ncbi:MAG: DUF1059 domain-containing protein [Halobacteriaceae archaeon]
MAKEYTCAAEGCTFVVRADDIEELISHVRRHAAELHGIAPTRLDIRRRARER